MTPRGHAGPGVLVSGGAVAHGAETEVWFAESKAGKRSAICAAKVPTLGIESTEITTLVHRALCTHHGICRGVVKSILLYPFYGLLCIAKK